MHKATRPLIVSLSSLALLAGCGDTTLWGDPQKRAMTQDSDVDIPPFEIGPASRWKTPGMYTDYTTTHNVVLISKHNMLVALLMINPDTGATVTYDSTANLFRDPQDNSVYTTDGLLWGESDSQFSLERCRIRHLGPLNDPDVPLMVDPGVRFSHERREWSKAASNHLFLVQE